MSLSVPEINTSGANSLPATPTDAFHDRVRYRKRYRVVTGYVTGCVTGCVTACATNVTVKLVKGTTIIVVGNTG